LFILVFLCLKSVIFVLLSSEVNLFLLSIYNSNVYIYMDGLLVPQDGPNVHHGLSLISQSLILYSSWVHGQNNFLCCMYFGWGTREVPVTRDSPYIGRSVRFRSVRSLKQLNVRIFLKKPVVRTNCPYFFVLKTIIFSKNYQKK
jgi:hypothetical protein